MYQLLIEVKFIITDLLSDFAWFRKLVKGNWYLYKTTIRYKTWIDGQIIEDTSYYWSREDIQVDDLNIFLEKKETYI